MIDQIKLFFEQHIALPATKNSSEGKIQIACAALLIEMMHIDNKLEAEEQRSVVCRLETLFELTPQQTEYLLELASQEREEATDYYQFTQLINREFSTEQKRELIESLWRVAYADGKLDAYEEFMVRKIADLLHLQHKDFIMTKHRVMSASVG
jgi:uncharacterized tellurite resistance protein B-like protein